MSTIYATSGAADASTRTEDLFAAAQKNLDQGDFLKLLIAQMTSQDPMNPMSNEDFMAQMAQFSALQETQTMSGNITALRNEQQVLQASSMLGKTVSLQTDEATPTTGVVSAVQINADGTPQLVVNGTPYDLSQVMSIKPTEATGS